MEIETPVLLAYAIEDSTDIFRISEFQNLNTPNPPPPLGTPLECNACRLRILKFKNAILRVGSLQALVKD